MFEIFQNAPVFGENIYFAYAILSLGCMVL